MLEIIDRDNILEKRITQATFCVPHVQEDSKYLVEFIHQNRDIINLFSKCEVAPTPLTNVFVLQSFPFFEKMLAPFPRTRGAQRWSGKMFSTRVPSN